MLDLHHLKHFMAVVRHRHFRHAAEDVHISQPALSRSIQALELSIGKPLLIRDHANVELTSHGRILAEHAEILLCERQRLREHLELAETQVEQRIVIGVGVLLAEQAGLEGAAALVGPDGRLPCRLQLGDFRQITMDLLARRIDLAFCDVVYGSQDDRLVCEAVCEEQIFAYTRPAHPLQQARAPRLVDVLGYPLIATRIPARFTAASEVPTHARDELTDEVLPALNTTNPSLAFKLLENSNAVAFATLSMIEHLLRPGHVALVPIRYSGLVMQAGFMHLRGRDPDPIALRYMQEVRHRLRVLANHNRQLEVELGVSEPHSGQGTMQ